jgi:hypothetical protein
MDENPVTPAPEDDQSGIDSCAAIEDAPSQDATSDEDLPVAEGGVS